MFFGLCSASSTFMQLMNEELKPFLEFVYVVNFDDILVYNESMSEHLMHLFKVFEALQTN